MTKGKQFKNVLAVWVTAVALGLLASVAQAGVYSGGTGTSADPFQIGSSADWLNLSTTSADWDKYFILIADLDFLDIFLTPIGNGVTTFSGDFNGNGHILRNCRVNLPAEDYVGLFGYLNFPGKIYNLRAKKVDIQGHNYVGWLVGISNGTIESCGATGMVTGTDFVGGLAGANQYTVSWCFYRGTTNGESRLGGLLGHNVGDVASCYADSKVIGSNSVGGLVGYLQTGTVTSCYSTGEITGTTNVGGLVGDIMSATVTSCYWDMDTSALSTSNGGEGRTMDEMTYPYADNTFVGWDFTGVWAKDPDYRLNSGYPYLRNCNFTGEEETYGCCNSTAKELTPKALLKLTLGDWLLVGLSVLALAAFSAPRK
jgi:hypothetical protein